MDDQKQCSPRTNATFLVSHHVGGHSFCCDETNFSHFTQCSHRVNLLYDYNLGLHDCTDEMFDELLKKQPIFHLMEIFGPDGRFQWNGRLLFSTMDACEGRKFILEHEDEYPVIMSFLDLSNMRFYFLVQTDANDFSVDSYTAYSKKTFSKIRRFVTEVVYHTPNFYVRCLPEHCYEILDRDALFGRPKQNIAEGDEAKRTCQTMSLGEILRRIFGRNKPETS